MYIFKTQKLTQSYWFHPHHLFLSIQLLTLDFHLYVWDLCIFQGTAVRVELGDATTAADPADVHSISRSFPLTYGQPLAHFLRASAKVSDAQIITDHPAFRYALGPGDLRVSSFLSTIICCFVSLLSKPRVYILNKGSILSSYSCCCPFLKFTIIRKDDRKPSCLSNPLSISDFVCVCGYAPACVSVKS
jgi:hypothetical protein